MASSGVRELDENIGLERQRLNGWFTVEPDFYFADDSAAPGAHTFREANGAATVALGVFLVQREIRMNPDHWWTAIIGVLAHEWAHALQYSSNLQDKAFMWETHADYLAGWYLGSKRASGLTMISPGPFAKSLYEKGSDKGFFDPDYYGTSQVRVEAMLKGFEFAAKNYVKGLRPDVRTAANAGYRHALERAK